MAEWQDISTAPKPHSWFHYSGNAVLACFHEHKDEDDNPTGEVTLIWSHVAYLTASGWMVSSSGFKGLHGNCSFPLHDNATHWMPLADEPQPRSDKEANPHQEGR